MYMHGVKGKALLEALNDLMTSLLMVFICAFCALQTCNSKIYILVCRNAFKSEEVPLSD